MTRAAARRAPRRWRAAGFTLVELLVGLVIAAIIVSMVAMNAVPNPERELRNDAERVAQLLQLAREEAQMRSAPIRFVADANEYGFAIRRGLQWYPVDGDQDLRRRRWPRETRVVVERPDGTTAIEFGRDAIEAPYRITLLRDGQAVRIEANGLGTFEVLPAS